MRVLDVVREQPRPCSYLDDRQAMLDHRILLDVNPEELERMLVRGWRRFGPDYFRPACSGCAECLPIRVPTATFEPSKSQRRAAKNLRSLEVFVGPPSVDEERLDLYHRWHQSRERARAWSEARLSERSYRLQFAFPHPAARELSFRDPTTHRLVGVGLCDQTPRAWSAIYFFYDPDYASLSLGTANVVAQLEIARARGIPHVYLGYCVRACASLAYKAAFRPQERLVGAPADDEEPTWVRVSEPVAAGGVG